MLLLHGRSFRSLLGGYRDVVAATFQFFAELLDFSERCAQMADYSGGNILRLGQPFLRLGFGVAQPGDVEVVVPALNFLPLKAAEPAIIALVLALRLSIWVLAERLLKRGKVIDRQWTRFSEGRHVGAHIIDPHRLGVGGVCLAVHLLQSLRRRLIEFADDREDAGGVAATVLDKIIFVIASNSPRFL